MPPAALSATLLQRLQRILRTDVADHSLTAGSDGDIGADSPQEVAETSFSETDTRGQEPAHIAFFEQAGTPTSPIIRWATTSEPSTACFNLERSTDGQQWRSVHLIAATGSANRGATYVVPVQAIGQGRQLFRVRQTLLDGTALLSSVLEMAPPAGAQTRVSIVPGRVTNFLHLRLADPQPASVTLRDERGTAVTGTVIHGPTARIDLGGVAPGIYFVYFLQAGMEETLRFEKE